MDASTFQHTHVRTGGGMIVFPTHPFFSWLFVSVGGLLILMALAVALCEISPYIKNLFRR